MPWGYAGREAVLLGKLVVLRLVVAGLELNTLLAALAAAPIAARSSDE